MKAWMCGAILAVFGAVTAQADYPGAAWVPAAPGNQTDSNRPDSQIRYIVIHIMEGSYAGSIAWFQNEASNVSAHFLFRSSDGAVTQMVRLNDTAWHAGNSSMNAQSVGIEHEARSSVWNGIQPTAWHTDAMYSSSATLVRWLSNRYNIPRTREWIREHREVSLSGTTCPTDFWNWTRYLAFVNQGAVYISDTIPAFMLPNQRVSVQVVFSNQSDFTWRRAAGNDQVTLQMANGVASPFFWASTWTSPTVVGVPGADTANGANATWTFDLQAPATAGTYSQSFQLHRASTGFFGPVLTLDINVGRYDLVRDNSDAQFSAVGSWTTATSATDKYGADYRFTTTATKTNAVGTWNLQAPEGGMYDVFAWWPQGTNRSAAVTYEVNHRRGVMRRVVNQQANGGRWNLLGRVTLPRNGGSVRVLGTSASPTVAMADAVRIVGPFR